MSVSDIGLNKAVVLINRINFFSSAQWKTYPLHLDKSSSNRVSDWRPEILIGCFDTRAADHPRIQKQNQIRAVDQWSYL